jgi:flavin-binding protein dodecin
LFQCLAIVSVTMHCSVRAETLQVGDVLQACTVAAHSAQPLLGADSLSSPDGLPHRRHEMTVARITEISSISTKSFEDAIVQGVDRANKTLKNVKGAWIKDQEVTVENGKVSGYKVILKITFVLE